MASSEEPIRAYLEALRNPDSLRDEETITRTVEKLENSEDAIERLRIQAQLHDLRKPSIERVEDDFITHAKSWADEAGITAEAFIAEGVDATVLRRAGFPISRGKASRGRPARSSRRRVTTDEVIAAMPDSPFTARHLRDVSGASQGVVRKAITQQQELDMLESIGTDPNHSGPGRAPELYQKK